MALSNVPPEPERIELYACMTPNVLKVMFVLGELELPFRIHHVRIYRGENFAEGFDALHPLRKLPVLVDLDGPEGGPFRIFESGAILIYLAEKTGRLLGEGAAERSTVMQWLMLQMSSLGPVLGNATHFIRTTPDQDYAVSRFRTQMLRLCHAYEARLREARYLGGESFSIADIAAFPWLWRHPRMLGVEIDRFPAMGRWIAEISQRPGLKAIHARYKALVQIDRADAEQAPPEILDRFLDRCRD